MHKEAVNTFNKGLIKDTHPLTTPADVLTDCLNGTVITYNGNELILQNDMGNVKIGSAALPEGYIPVGITEYGGIIYIASYNPSTKKGQIGSFPSPQQKHGADMWSVNMDYGTPIGINSNTKNMFYISPNKDDIIRTEYKIPLGQVQQNVNSYMLHTGDKIRFSSPDEEDYTGLEDLLSNEYIQVQFGVLKSDSSIEIVEGDYLQPGYHVYTGKSSGYPMIIIKLLTLKAFNLERTYTRGDEGTVNVTFTGKVEKEVTPNYINLNSVISVGEINEKQFSTSNQGIIFKDNIEEQNIVGASLNSDGDALQFTVKNCEMQGKLAYTVNPYLYPQGNLITMQKKGTIDLSKFKSDTKDLTNWSYLILDNYIKINWSFDYYNLDSSTEFKQIDFTFYDIINPNNYVYKVEIVKDSFNGSFEEIINFNEHLQRNRIYVVRITAYKADNNGNPDSQQNVHIGNRLLYTSKIFNNYYGTVKDFTNKGFAEESPSAIWYPQGDPNNDYWKMPFKKTIGINLNSSVKVNKGTTSVNLTDPTGRTRTYSNVEDLVQSDFSVKTNDTGTKVFRVTLNTPYTFTADLQASIVNDSNLIGVPSESTISAILDAYSYSSLLFTDQSTKIGTMNVTNGFQTLDEYATTPIDTTVDTNTATLIYPELSVQQYMIARSTDIKTTVIDKVGAMPLYYTDMKATFKDKAFTAWNENNPRLCCGAGETDICYNSTLTSDGASTDAGADDYGLNAAMEHMNLPMVSIFRGTDGDEACYCPSGMPDRSMGSNGVYNGNQIAYRRRTVAGWGNGDGEIDSSDNFLVTVWKQTDNQYRFGLLASQRQYDSKTGRLIRLDYMLRALLSQIFTKQLHKNTIKYVTTSSDDFGYYEPNVSVETDLIKNDYDYNDVEYTDDSKTTNYDILYGEETIENLIKQFSDLNETDSEGSSVKLTPNEIMTIKYEYIINLIPKSTSFAQDTGISYVGNLLTGSTYKEQEGDINDGTDERYIYVVDWTAIKNALDANNESLVTNFKDNSIYSIGSDCTFNWKVDNMTPYLKLSGTKDGYGVLFDGTMDPNNENSPAYMYCNLYGGAETTEYQTIMGVTRQLTTFAYDNNGTQGGVTKTGLNYGDVLMTWDGKKWPFYHSFQHMFTTYCAWQNQSLSSETEIYNEIVLNRDHGYIGEFNSHGTWTDGKDEDAPDITPLLGNSYNSIYARCNTLNGVSISILENAST